MKKKLIIDPYCLLAKLARDIPKGIIKYSTWLFDLAKQAQSGPDLLPRYSLIASFRLYLPQEEIPVHFIGSQDE